MPTREDIREGLQRIASEWFRPGGFSSRKMVKGRSFGSDAVDFLHSQGVVRKVEGKLPDTYTSELGEYGAVILEDGTYLEVVAVEPLIKEENNER